ncbi:MAG: cysteine desulfurase family protein [Lachnospiraceae bacterium]|nr:cysteine desulfurase family protein [Lachnospiraceae bacterium]
MEIYFDNGATTRVFPQVREKMDQVLEEEYGNPSSMHGKGLEAEHHLKHTREVIAKSLKVDPKEITFTSGGTESNNLAIIGTALANQRRGRHLITSTIEHASVYNPFFFLEEMGFEVTFVPVDETGIIRMDKLKEAIREDTTLVSVMAVNNEIGSVMPLEEIGKAIKERNPNTYFHTDCVQAYGKMRLFPRRWKVDLLSISGHKIHGPKGSGVLYIRNGVKIKPILYGGNQELGLRSGTENVPAIAGLGTAAELIYEDHEARITHLQEVKDYFLEKVLLLPDTKNHSGMAPHIASVSFLGVRSEVLLHALEDKGICVSAGSACSSNKPAVSGTLKGIGLSKEEYESTLRFTFSCYNTKEEVNIVVSEISSLLPMLRRFVRK